MVPHELVALYPVQEGQDEIARGLYSLLHQPGFVVLLLTSFIACKKQELRLFIKVPASTTNIGFKKVLLLVESATSSCLD